MLNGEGNENSKKITTIGPISKIADYNVKFPSCTFYGGNVPCVPVRFFFFHCRSFSPWWPLAFLTATIQKLSCFSSKEIRLLCFLSLALALSLLSTSV